MTANANSSPDASGKGHFRVLFICSGNTCRSPMAEGILKKLLADVGDRDTQISVQSAGTMGMVGQPATDLAIKVAAQFDVDISEHRSQGLTPRLLHESDLVLALAAEHWETAHSLGKTAESLFMLKSFPNQSGDRRTESVDDPIGGNQSRYEKAYFEIEEAIRRALPSILQRAGITQ